MLQRCFAKIQELTLGGAEGMELRFARRYNKQVSHYDGSETGKCIGNVQEEKNKENSVNRRNRGKRFKDEMSRKKLEGVA